jgi:hypothetical protein
MWCKGGLTCRKIARRTLKARKVLLSALFDGRRNDDKSPVNDKMFSNARFPYPPHQHHDFRALSRHERTIVEFLIFFCLRAFLGRKGEV